MQLDKLNQYLGNFGGISPPQSETEIEFEIRTRTANIFVTPDLPLLKSTLPDDPS